MEISKYYMDPNITWIRIFQGYTDSSWISGYFMDTQIVQGYWIFPGYLDISWISGYFILKRYMMIFLGYFLDISWIPRYFKDIEYFPDIWIFHGY